MIEEALQAIAASYTREAMLQTLVAWWRTFHYRWRDGHIVHPLSVAETRSRQRILDAGYAFLARRLEP